MEERLGPVLSWLKLHFLVDYVTPELRKLLLEKLKKMLGKEWDGSPESVKSLTNNIGKGYRSASGPVRNKIDQGDIENWDLTAVSHVLRSLNSEWVSEEEKERMEAAVQIRNHLAHHLSKVIPQEEFDENRQTLTEVLSFLNVPTARIGEIEEKIKFRTSDSSSIFSPCVSNAEARKLIDEAFLAFSYGDYAQAIKKFDDALEVASLKEAEHGVLFCYRSAAFLQLAKEECYHKRKDFAKRARKDAKKAAQFHPMWNTVHSHLGDAYNWLEKYEKAIISYDEALSLDPSMGTVRTRRNECLQKSFQRRRQDHLDHLEIHPLSVDLKVEQSIKNEMEKTITECLEKYPSGLWKKSGPGSADEVKDAVRCCDEIYRMAYEVRARDFSIATQEGNARGIYVLARLTKKGLLVMKDYPMALKLFKQAAEMQPILPNGRVNEGVLPAMHCIAMMYDEGDGVLKSSDTAFDWYERAAKLGFGPSANNLAVMYILGKGVPKEVPKGVPKEVPKGVPVQDSVKAAQYWKLAAQVKSTRAMHSLAGYYLKTGDAGLARTLFQFAVEGGETLARSRQQEFKAACKALEDNTSKAIANLEKWEKKKGLSSSKVSVKDRMDRFFRSDDMHIFMKKYNNFRRQIAVSPTRYTNVYECDYNVIAEYASKDRVYAKQVLKALQHFLSASRSLDNYKKSSDAGEVDYVIKEAARCFATAEYVSYFGEEDRNLLMELVEQKLADLKDQICDMERYARQCYAFLRLPSYEENVTFLKECIARYPTYPYFYTVLAYTHGYLEQYDEGKKVAQKGLDLCPEDYQIMCSKAYSAIDGSQDKAQKASDLFPKNFELMYNKAYLTFLAFDGDQGMQNVIDCYDTFLQHAPSDHRKVPEAYYSMALLTLTKQQSLKDDAKIDETVRTYYEKGLESEKKLLPCFLPYEDLSKTKDAVCAYLETMEEKESDERKKNKEKESDERNKNKRTDPVRVQAIQDHRKSIRDPSRNEFDSTIATTITPPYAQCAPPTLDGLKRITILEMNPMTSTMHEGHVMEVFIIDEPGPPVPSVNVVLEDTRGDVIRGNFYNVEDDNRIKYGGKISIQHPYMEVFAGDAKPVIRVRDLKSLVFHEEDSSDHRCRSCSERKAPKTCTDCNRAAYCSEDCQTHDSEILNHQLHCKKKL